MSLNDIKLPDIVISELYGKTPLVHSPSVAASPASETYRFLGSNRKHITIIVDAPGSPFLPDEQLTFLTRMLEACRLNIGDVAIVNQATAPVTIAKLKSQLVPSVMLLFGLEPVDIHLPLNFPVFKTQSYDQCTYLSAPSLEQLARSTEEGKLLKSKLWVCLKPLFEV